MKKEERRQQRKGRKKREGRIKNKEGRNKKEDNKKKENLLLWKAGAPGACLLRSDGLENTHAFGNNHIIMSKQTTSTYQGI